MAPQIVKNNPDNPRNAFVAWLKDNMDVYEEKPDYKGITKWILSNYDLITQSQSQKISSSFNFIRTASLLDANGFHDVADELDAVDELINR
jgi:hypothetical protein